MIQHTLSLCLCLVHLLLVALLFLLFPYLLFRKLLRVKTFLYRFVLVNGNFLECCNSKFVRVLPFSISVLLLLKLYFHGFCLRYWNIFTFIVKTSIELLLLENVWFKILTIFMWFMLCFAAPFALPLFAFIPASKMFIIAEIIPLWTIIGMECAFGFSLGGFR